jgi:hypothetical protein
MRSQQQQMQQQHHSHGLKRPLAPGSTPASSNPLGEILGGIHTVAAAAQAAKRMRPDLAAAGAAAAAATGMDAAAAGGGGARAEVAGGPRGPAEDDDGKSLGDTVDELGFFTRTMRVAGLQGALLSREGLFQHVLYAVPHEAFFILPAQGVAFVKCGTGADLEAAVVAFDKQTCQGCALSVARARPRGPGFGGGGGGRAAPVYDNVSLERAKKLPKERLLATHELVYRVEHPEWNKEDSLLLTPDGNFRRVKRPTETGKWSLTGSTLLLKWEKWKPESLEAKQEGRVFDNGRAPPFRMTLVGATAVSAPAVAPPIFDAPPPVTATTASGAEEDGAAAAAGPWSAAAAPAATAAPLDAAALAERESEAQRLREDAAEVNARATRTFVTYDDDFL